jgi:phosphoribosylanthranilate isomerase
MTHVKICGLTNPEDVLVAEDAGADLLGFVNAPNSPRYLTPDEINALITETEPIIPTVMVTHSIDVTEILNNFEAAGAGLLQIHAPLMIAEYDEIKSVVPGIIANISIPSDAHTVTPQMVNRVKAISQIADYILLDAKVGAMIGGTSTSYDWSLARDLINHSEAPVFIAGGLNPGNVKDAIAVAQPTGVDVSSGVEDSPGKKSTEKLIAFIKAVKGITD